MRFLRFLIWLTILYLIFAATDSDAAVLPVPVQTGMRQQECSGTRPGAGIACALPDGWMEIPRGSGPSTYWHEVFHEIDMGDAITDATRAKLQELTGYTGPWWGEVDSINEQGDVAENYSPPAEKIADAFSLCQMQATGRRMLFSFEYGPRGYALKARVVGYGYTQPYLRHRRVCQVIWRSLGAEWTVARPREPKQFRGDDFILSG